METHILRNKKALFFLVTSLAFVSCDSNQVFDQYQSLENNTWHKDSLISFEFQISDTLSKNNLYINIRNNEDYAFNNLFLITHLDFPDGKKVVDTLQYKMADNNGRFLGSGMSEIKENKLFYKELSIFPKPGSYNFSVRQAMRRNGSVDGISELEGITDVGLRIEKVE